MAPNSLEVGSTPGLTNIYMKLYFVSFLQIKKNQMCCVLNKSLHNFFFTY